MIIIEEDMEEELSVPGDITNEAAGVDKIAEVNDIDSFLRNITVENKAAREPSRVAGELTMVQSGNASESMRALQREAPGADDEYYDYFVEEEEEEEPGVFRKVTKASEVDKVSNLQPVAIVKPALQLPMQAAPQPVVNEFTEVMDFVPVESEASEDPNVIKPV